MTSLSKKYIINNVYLDQVFKKEMEISFKEYLNNVRIDKVVELLAGSDERIYTMAEKVGHGKIKGGDTMQYRNMFKEAGISEEEITRRVTMTFMTLFYGSEEERIYHEAANDMSYIEDTGNHDVRTEGMSYGMMMCVQMNKKQEFDRLWKWARTYMWMEDGTNAGYFAWSCQTNGKKNSYGPAPDGEEYFAMALLFAAHRFGNGDGIFDYEKEAKTLLSVMIHKGEDGAGAPMWNQENHLIKFIAECDFSDPSYHLPHFYELFAKWGNVEDADFWRKAAKSSREYLKLACHKDTGLCAEYAEYDGSPCMRWNHDTTPHYYFYSDSYRTVANIGLDALWSKTEELSDIATTYQKFVYESLGGVMEGIYSIDGHQMEGNALHPVAIIATTAQASLASHGSYAKDAVLKFWNTPLRTGERRYYDNCLYFFAMLALSGNYRIYDADC